MTEDDPIALAAGIVPQGFGRVRASSIGQPVVEPLWLGRRVIAGVTERQAAIYEGGEPIAGQQRIEARLTRMIAHTAAGVVLDGYLTKQSAASILGVAADTGVTIPTTSQLVTKAFVGMRRDRAGERIRRLDAEAAAREFADDDIVNLVLTDLLWLDGEWLLDVPLLERKRLLEAVVVGDDLVRAGPYVQPPYETWIGSWRAQGFGGISVKDANSRYRPGEEAADWATSDMPRR